MAKDAGAAGVKGATGAGLKSAADWSAFGAPLRAIWAGMALSLGQLTSMTAKLRRTNAPPANDLGSQRSASTVLDRLATQVGEPVHLDGGMHLHRHLGFDPLEQVRLEFGSVFCGQAGYGGVVVAICQLNCHPDQAPLDLMAVQRDEMVDGHVELDRSGIDRQHLDRAQRRKEAGRQVLARKLEPWEAVLLEDDHDGVRLDVDKAVKGMRIAGELHAQCRLFSRHSSQDRWGQSESADQ